MMKENEKAEFLGQLIDIFEDFLDEKGIVIPNEERDMDPNLDPDNSANIYGRDYDSIRSGLEEILVNWGILESDAPMAEYLFKVSLNGVPCEGKLAVKATDEDAAYQIAKDMVSDRLCTAFPELDIEYGIDFVDADPDSSTPDPRGNVTWGYPCKSNYNNCLEQQIAAEQRIQQLVKAMDDADAFISSQEELEMDYFDHYEVNGKSISGWFACRYNGSCSTILSEFSDHPLITDEEIEKYGIDIRKVFDDHGIAYCG